MAKVLFFLFVVLNGLLSCQSNNKKLSPKETTDLIWQDACKCDSAEYKIKTDAFDNTQSVYGGMTFLSHDYKQGLKKDFHIPISCTVSKNISDSVFYIFFEIHGEKGDAKPKCYTTNSEAIFIMQDSSKVTISNAETNCKSKFYYTCHFSDLLELQNLAALRMQKVKAVRFYDTNSYYETNLDDTTAKWFNEKLNCTYKAAN